jgi:hypothetical protein
MDMDTDMDLDIDMVRGDIDTDIGHNMDIGLKTTNS